jgi:hypothetical protein
LPPQRGPGALQSTVYGWDTRFEQSRRVLRRPAENVAQNQNRTLPRRQVFDRDEERKFDRQVRDNGHVRRCARRRYRFEQSVGIDPLARGTLSGVLPTLKRRQACVRRDPIEPGPERGVAPKGLALVPGTQECLLSEILRILARPEDPIRVRN